METIYFESFLIRVLTRNQYSPALLFFSIVVYIHVRKSSNRNELFESTCENPPVQNQKISCYSLVLAFVDDDRDFSLYLVCCAEIGCEGLSGVLDFRALR